MEIRLISLDERHGITDKFKEFFKEPKRIRPGAYGVQRFLQSIPEAGGKFFSSETESDLSLDTRCVMVWDFLMA